MNKDYNQLAGQRISRIEALSDGVFAIALTLLVLDIRVPVNDLITSEGELLAAFSGLLSKFVSYFLSFLTLGIFWIGHSSQHDYIDKSDRILSWISLFFLMFVSLLPFTTAFLSEYITFKLSIGLYWLNLFALGFMLWLHWVYAERHEYLSLPIEQQVTVSSVIKWRIISAQTLYAIGALLCFINTYLSITIIVLIQLNYTFGFISRLRRVQPEQ